MDKMDKELFMKTSYSFQEGGHIHSIDRLHAEE